MANALGIDVSYANAGDTTSPSVDFVIARATYGTAKDGRYNQHIASAKSQRKITGAYGFGTYKSGYEQAVAFLAAAGTVDLYALDLEVEAGKRRMTDTQARAFIAYVKTKKGHCLLYHSDSGFPYLGQTGHWVAKWGPTAPSRPWQFWQYHGAPLDRDMFHGTLDQLKAFVGRPVPAPLPDTSTIQYWNVAIVGATRIYNRPFGTVVGTVTKASYRCTRTKVSGVWWYKIISKIDKSPTSLAGRYFRASSNTLAHWA